MKRHQLMLINLTLLNQLHLHLSLIKRKHLIDKLN
jgi:hypothetical protein